jgi:hypothetical protein
MSPFDDRAAMKAIVVVGVACPRTASRPSSGRSTEAASAAIRETQLCGQRPANDDAIDEQNHSTAHREVSK